MVVIKKLPQWILSLQKVAPYNGNGVASSAVDSIIESHYDQVSYIEPQTAVSSSLSCVSFERRIFGQVSTSADFREVRGFGEADGGASSLTKCHYILKVDKFVLEPQK
jgi:hypothetical protein